MHEVMGENEARLDDRQCALLALATEAVSDAWMDGWRRHRETEREREKERSSGQSG